MVNVLDKDKILWYVMRAYKNENTAEDRLSNETMELAYRFSEDIEGYCTGKDAFVKQLEKDALLWYQNNESYKTR